MRLDCEEYDALELAERLLELLWRDRVASPQPHLLHKIGVGQRKQTLRADGVVPIEVRLEMVVDEVLSKLLNVGKALQPAAHEAGVAQVLDADQTLPRLAVHRRQLQVALIEFGTPHVVKDEVALLAILRAIEGLPCKNRKQYLFALANFLDLLVRFAVLAEPYDGLTVAEEEPFRLGAALQLEYE